MLLSRYALRQELSQRDRLGIATSCAALQLLPANASHLDRLCALSATALSLGRDDGDPPNTDDLARWLITGPTLHKGASWDPYEGPFAEPINFYGGGYVLQSGGNAEAVFNLRTLLSAVFAHSEPLESPALCARTVELREGRSCARDPRVRSGQRTAMGITGGKRACPDRVACCNGVSECRGPL